MKQLLAVILGCILFSACMGRKEEAEKEEGYVETDSAVRPADTLQLVEDAPVPVTADELFNDFFYTFVTDPRFQESRVCFPLRSSGSRSHAVGRSEWGEKSPFGQAEYFSMIYDRDRDMSLQKDTTLRRVSVEWIYLNSGHAVSYNFRKQEGRWMLADYDEAPLSHSPHGGFMEFYARFSSDTLFQAESIRFPLRLVTRSEGDEEGGEMELTPDDWDRFREEMPLPAGVMTNINYGQPALSENRKILLVEGLSNSLFVKYKFDHTDGRWTLYEVEN